MNGPNTGGRVEGGWGGGDDTQIKLQFTCRCFARSLSPEELYACTLHTTPLNNPFCIKGGPRTILQHVYVWHLWITGAEGCLQFSSSICSFVQPKFCPCGNSSSVVSFISFHPEYSDCIAPVLTCPLFKAHEKIKSVNLTMGMSKTDPIPGIILLAPCLTLSAVHSEAHHNPPNLYSLMALLFPPNLLCRRQEDTCRIWCDCP